MVILILNIFIMSTANQKLHEINNFINLQKTWYNHWYIWITNDWKRRLNEHNVKDWYIIREFTNAAIAREVEEIFISKWCKWWNWWWDNSSNLVYAYIVKQYTAE